MNTRAGSRWQSPVTIPEKLLLRIFTYLHDEVLPPQIEADQLNPLILISHVCQFWRKIAISHEQFWCDVDFGNKDLALLCLSRTDLDTPLHVRFTGTGGPAACTDEYQCVKQRISSLKINPRDYTDIHPILRFFVHNPPSCNFRTFHIGEKQYTYPDGEIDLEGRDLDSRFPTP